MYRTLRGGHARHAAAPSHVPRRRTGAPLLPAPSSSMHAVSLRALPSATAPLRTRLSSRANAASRSRAASVSTMAGFYDLSIKARRDAPSGGHRVACGQQTLLGLTRRLARLA